MNIVDEANPPGAYQFEFTCQLAVERREQRAHTDVCIILCNKPPIDSAAKEGILTKALAPLLNKVSHDTAAKE